MWLCGFALTSGGYARPGAPSAPPSGKSSRISSIVNGRSSGSYRSHYDCIIAADGTMSLR